MDLPPSLVATRGSAPVAARALLGSSPHGNSGLISSDSCSIWSILGCVFSEGRWRDFPAATRPLPSHQRARQRADTGDDDPADAPQRLTLPDTARGKSGSVEPAIITKPYGPTSVRTSPHCGQRLAWQGTVLGGRQQRAC